MKKILKNNYVVMLLDAFDWISSRFWAMIVLPTMYATVVCYLVGMVLAAVMYTGMFLGLWDMHSILGLVQALGGRA